MSDRVFILPGDESHLRTVAPHVGDSVCGILLHQRGEPESLALAGESAKVPREKVYTLDSLRAFEGRRPSRSQQARCAAFLNAILSDPRAHYLAQRSSFDSAFNNSIGIEKIVANSISIIAETGATCLVASSTPHSVEAWVFAKCFELSGFPVLILESTPIAFRSWIYRGLDTQEVVPIGAPEANEVSASTQQLVRNQQRSQAGEKDASGYPVSRIYLSSVAGSESNKWWSYRRELRWLLSGRFLTMPYRIASSVGKKRLFDAYSKVCTAEIPDGDFVVFFMHYQPERSSLPVGLNFSQQWFAIRTLSQALPEGWSLLVREHPTTWLKPLDLSVRTKTIYTDIAALDNVRVCSMDVDTFDLVDRSRAVATLTGSVGFQALIREKPVMAFGLAPYKDHPACYAVSTQEHVEEALNDIANDRCTGDLSAESLQRYLLWVERNSVNVDEDEEDWRNVRLQNFVELYRHLLSGGVSLRGKATPQ